MENEQAMNEIEWSDPEVINKPPGFKEQWKDTIKQLDDRPGDWAIIARNAYPGLPTQLKKVFPGYEFTARNIQNRKAERIYGRKKVI